MGYLLSPSFDNEKKRNRIKFCCNMIYIQHIYSIVNELVAICQENIIKSVNNEVHRHPSWYTLYKLKHISIQWYMEIYVDREKIWYTIDEIDANLHNDRKFLWYPSNGFSSYLLLSKIMTPSSLQCSCHTIFSGCCRDILLQICIHMRIYSIRNYDKNMIFISLYIFVDFRIEC